MADPDSGIPSAEVGTTPANFSFEAESSKRGRGQRWAAILAAASFIGIATGAWFLQVDARPPSGTSFGSADTGAGSADDTSLVSNKSGAVSAGQASCPTDMVKVPGGQFFMGSDLLDALDIEKPAHRVEVGAFCIDRTEVTVGAYRSCSSTGECQRASRHVSWPGISETNQQVFSELCNEARSGVEDHPVNCVSWEMARQFCAAQGKRLPSEAEWEFASRGSDGRVYPWGDEPPTLKHLNACGQECVNWMKEREFDIESMFDGDDGFFATAPVGTFPQGASRYGALDIVGNVWEWVEDRLVPYESGEQGPALGEDAENPSPQAPDKRVIRGGAFNGSDVAWLRPSYRYGQDPAAKSHAIGFRCATAL